MKTKYALALLLIFSFHVGANAWVLSKSQVTHIYDESSRILNSADIFFLSQACPNLFQMVVDITQLDEGQAHPRFFEIVEAISWKMLGGVDENKIEWMILITNSIFLLIMIASIYGLGSILYGSNVGLLAAFLTPLFPLVFGHSRLAMLDFPLACMISMSFFLLFKTKGFSSIFYSCLFGIVAGLSELTKEAALVFIVIPLGYYFAEAYSKGNKPKIISNLCLAIFFFVAISGIVYFQKNNWDVYGIYLGKIAIKQPRPAWFYWGDFYNFTGPVALVFCAPFLLRALYNFKKRNVFLFLWFFIPTIIFSLSPNKAMRFLLPIAPAFALIIAREILDDRLPRMLRRSAAFLLILFVMVQYGLYHTRLFHNLWHGKGDYLDEGMLFVQENHYLSTVNDLFDILKKEEAGLGKTKEVLALFNVGEINGPLNLKFGLARAPFHMDVPLQMDVPLLERFGEKNWGEYVLEADYLLDMEANHSEQTLSAEHTAIRDKMKEGFLKYNNNFIKIGQVPVHDGSRIDIYKRIKK
jgi:hypothetical protein